MNYRTVDYTLYQPHGDYYMEGEVPPGPSETHGKDQIGHGQVENPLTLPSGAYNPRAYRRRQREQQAPGAAYIRPVHHEQSETVDVPGGYSQVYGKKTPQAGQPIPKRYDFEKPVYPNLQEALGSAIVRSDLEGRRMGAAGLRHR